MEHIRGMTIWELDGAERSIVSNGEKELHSACEEGMEEVGEVSQASSGSQGTSGSYEGKGGFHWGERGIVL